MESEKEKMRIATTILEQLGGGSRVKAMIGVKRFVQDNGDLMFDFKMCRKANFVIIHLNGSDLYDMTFYRKRELKLVNVNGMTTGEPDMTEKMKFTDLYNDQLIDTFESYTGLRLSL